MGAHRLISGCRFDAWQGDYKSSGDRRCGVGIRRASAFANDPNGLSALAQAGERPDPRALPIRRRRALDASRRRLPGALGLQRQLRFPALRLALGDRGDVARAGLAFDWQRFTAGDASKAAPSRSSRAPRWATAFATRPPSSSALRESSYGASHADEQRRFRPECGFRGAVRDDAAARPISAAN
jgi:hypothetical protein